MIIKIVNFYLNMGFRKIKIFNKIQRRWKCQGEMSRGVLGFLPEVLFSVATIVDLTLQYMV